MYILQRSNTVLQTTSLCGTAMHSRTGSSPNATSCNPHMPSTHAWQTAPSRIEQSNQTLPCHIVHQARQGACLHGGVWQILLITPMDKWGCILTRKASNLIFPHPFIAFLASRLAALLCQVWLSPEAPVSHPLHESHSRKVPTISYCISVSCYLNRVDQPLQEHTQGNTKLSLLLAGCKGSTASLTQVLRAGHTFSSAQPGSPSPPLQRQPCTSHLLTALCR